MVTQLDVLLPEVSTAALRVLLGRRSDERPAEGLFYEFKSDFTPRHVAKTVSAFANTLGGFLVFGATTEQGHLEAFPGLPDATEWPREVANNIIEQVSPLPSWEPFVVESPTAAPRVVLVVKVPPSRRTPHIVTTSGRIYQRSPGGTSDPIRDRATLDLLVRRGLDGERAVRERAEHHLQDFVLQDPISFYLGSTEASFVVVAVPTPFGSAPQVGLLTSSGYLGSPALFVPGSILTDGHPVGMVEEGVRLDFGSDARVLVLQDGTLTLAWRGRHPFLPVPTMARMLGDLLAAQRRLHPPVHESRVFVLLQTGGQVHLSERMDARVPGRNVTAPIRWRWETDAVTAGESLRDAMEEFSRRLWRAAGVEEFDPD